MFVKRRKVVTSEA